MLPCAFKKKKKDMLVHLHMESLEGESWGKGKETVIFEPNSPISGKQKEASAGAGLGAEENKTSSS